MLHARWGTATANGVEFVAGYLAAFILTYLLVPWLIPQLKKIGMVGHDLNKPNKPAVAEMGGISVVVGFFGGVSVFTSLDGIANLQLLYVSLSAVLGAAFVGMMDDLFNLRQREKALLPFVLALPFASAADPYIVFPHVLEVNFGPWMILGAAFAVTCAANAANMLEGFNGLGAGLGVIMSFTLLSLCVIHNRMDGAYLLVPLLGALIAFLYFNKHPSRIFPGDTLMLFMGATMAVAGILSSIQVQTAVIFLPMVLEFFLKLRGGFRAENYCSDSANGYLEYHGRIESITHFFMKHLKVREQELVAFVWGIEIAVCAFVISIDLLV